MDLSRGAWSTPVGAAETSTFGDLFSVSPNHTVARLDVRSIRRILLEVAKAKTYNRAHPHAKTQG